MAREVVVEQGAEDCPPHSGVDYAIEDFAVVGCGGGRAEDAAAERGAVDWAGEGIVWRLVCW